MQFVIDLFAIFLEYLAANAAKYRKKKEGRAKTGWGVIGKSILELFELLWFLGSLEAALAANLITAWKFT